MGWIDVSLKYYVISCNSPRFLCALPTLNGSFVGIFWIFPELFPLGSPLLLTKNVSKILVSKKINEFGEISADFARSARFVKS